MFCPVLRCWENVSCSLHAGSLTRNASENQQEEFDDLRFLDVLLEESEQRCEEMREAPFRLHSALQEEMEDMRTKMIGMESSLASSKLKLEHKRNSCKRLQAQVNCYICEKENFQLEKDLLESKIEDLMHELKEVKDVFECEKKIWQQRQEKREEEMCKREFERGKFCVLQEVAGRVKKNQKQMERNTLELNETLLAKAEAEKAQKEAEAAQREGERVAEEACVRATMQRQRAETYEVQLKEYERPFPVASFIPSKNERGKLLFNDMNLWTKDLPRYKGFERICGYLLEAMTGKRVAISETWQDGGVDLILYHPSKTPETGRAVAIVLDTDASTESVSEAEISAENEEKNICALAQCKLYTSRNALGVEVVRNLVGSSQLRYRKSLAIDKLYVITSHYFTKDAEEESKSNELIELIDRDLLIMLFDEHYDVIVEKLKIHNRTLKEKYDLRQTLLWNCGADFRNLLGAEQDSEQILRDLEGLSLKASASKGSLVPSCSASTTTSSIPSCLSFVSSPLSVKKSPKQKTLTSKSVRKERREWSEEETAALLYGVKSLGKCWAEIESKARSSQNDLKALQGRSQGQLKDKYRTLVQRGIINDTF